VATRRGQIALVALFVLCGSVGLFWSAARPLVAAEELPKQLTDEVFWRLATDFSEAGGYFRSDNFVSNEVSFQFVIPKLKQDTRPGGVYLGVGPDQNFSYIVALEPKIAFIFDIRRQNMLQHLMYKALIEMSADRVDFTSRLFSRKRPASLPASASPEELFNAYDEVSSDRSLYETNLKAIFNRLEKDHGFKLSEEDEKTIEYVYKAFFDAGPDINYSFSTYGGGRGRMPTYADLMKQTDNQGMNRAYMANEKNFQLLKTLQRNNLIIPLVGDFAGDKAIRAVGNYLKEHDAHVTAFYLSNVEQYLFQDPENWKKFYTNVGTLPIDSSSTFIRSVFNGMGGVYATPGFGYMRSINQLCSMVDVVKAFNEGLITGYADVVRMGK
jgi:hypothetical protein